MKILITGGAGFIGSNLARKLLDAGNQVFVVDNLLTGKLDNLESMFLNSNFTFLRCGVETNEFLDFCKEIGGNFDRVYHLACVTGVPNIEALGKEILLACSVGTLNVLNVAFKADADLLFTSSSEIYGEPLKTPQDETYTGNVDPLGPRANYEEGKRFSETLVSHFVRKYQLRARMVRLFNVYGPGMALDDTRVVPRFAVQAIKNEPVTVQGDGSQLRTFCFIDDILNGFEAVISKGIPGEIYNLGSDKEMSIKELAEYVIRLAGSYSPIHYIPRPAHDHSSRMPVLDKIRSLGWESTVDFDTGLKLTSADFLKRLLAPEKNVAYVVKEELLSPIRMRKKLVKLILLVLFLIDFQIIFFRLNFFLPAYLFVVNGIAAIFSIFHRPESFLGALVIIVLVWGASFIFWGLIGLIRFVTETIGRFLFADSKNIEATNDGICKEEVAVMIPAHNEELVIRDTLTSLLNIVESGNIFVVSDGSSDMTIKIARSFNVNVLDLEPNRGKAGALEECFNNFNLASKFKAVIFVDADTRLKHDYLKYALPFFNDPKVVAVAGYASTMWNPKRLSWKQTLFVSHRDRIYFLGQLLIKFGQTWKYINVTPIIPGFASIYRTSAIEKINLNPQGLIIEDFNMTFEIHHKKLGIIAHHPSVVGYTQDPDNWRDYYRQVKRWHLGFWQTIRFHGFWSGKFWASLSLTLVEVFFGSFIFALLPFLILLFLLLNFYFFHTTWLNPNIGPLLFAVIIGVWLSDYLLTVVASIFQKRPQYLLVGLLFPMIRFLDAVAFLSGIPRAFLTKSNGKWVSPSRRTI